MTTELCDHCGEDVAGHRRMICATVKSHSVDEKTGRAVQARVNTQRWWRFCSEKCAAEWYATETEEHYLPTGPIPPAPKCKANRGRPHDFPSAPEGSKGPTITIKDGQFRIEHADGRIEKGDYIPGMHLGAAPSLTCRHCGLEASEVMPKAPHLIDEGEHRDRLLRLVALHVLPGQEPEVVDHQIFEEPHQLNTYWRSGGPPTPVELDAEGRVIERRRRA